MLTKTEMRLIYKIALNNFENKNAFINSDPELFHCYISHCNFLELFSCGHGKNFWVKFVQGVIDETVSNNN